VKVLGILAVVMFVLAACQQPAPVIPPLPPEQAAPLIAKVQNYTLGNGVALKDNIENAIKGLAAKGLPVSDIAWSAFPGTKGCPACTLVVFSAAINKAAERYEFILRDDGKTVEPNSDGARLMFRMRPAPPKTAAAPGAAEATPGQNVAASPAAPAVPLPGGKPPAPASPPPPPAPGAKPPAPPAPPAAGK